MSMSITTQNSNMLSAKLSSVRPCSALTLRPHNLSQRCNVVTFVKPTKISDFTSLDDQEIAEKVSELKQEVAKKR